MKKLSAIFVTLALSLLVVKPAFAQEAIVVDFNGVLDLNDNFGLVLVDSNSFANSGNNSAEDEGTVTTSSATAGTTVDNGMNSSSLTGSLTDSNSGPVASNTDPKDSDPWAVAVDANLVGVINFDRGFIGNVSLALANSGWNYGGYDSTVAAGTAVARTNTDSDLNTNSTDVIVTDESSSGPMATNVDYDGDGVAVAADVNGVLVADLNMGGVCNFSVASANSGINITGEYSTVKTLGATATTTTATDMNSNDTTVAISTEGEGSVAANVDFDECDSTVAVAADVNAALVLNKNFGGVDNFSVAGANTGFNYGGEDSTVTTGAAVARTTTSTNLNQNTTSVTIADNANGSVSVNAEKKKDFDPCNPSVPGPCDEPTCCQSESCCLGHDNGPVAANIGNDDGVAVAIAANIAVVANENMGKVSNTSVSSANSGANAAGGDKSMVNTGTATASTATTSDVNNNDTTVTITEGSDSLLEGEGSGPLAVNEDADEGTAVAVDANLVVVANDNEATVVNNSTAVANTGDNGSQPDKCSSDCGGDDDGSITTGSATATTTTTNNINSNTTTFTINH